MSLIMYIVIVFLLGDNITIRIKLAEGVICKEYFEKRIKKQYRQELVITQMKTQIRF